MDHLKNKTQDELIQELLRVTPIKNRKSVKPSTQKRLNMSVQTTKDIQEPSTSNNTNGMLKRQKEGGLGDQVNGKPTLDIRSKENVHVHGITTHATHDLNLNPLVHGDPSQEKDPKRLWSVPTSNEKDPKRLWSDSTSNKQNNDQSVKNDQTQNQNDVINSNTNFMQFFMKTVCGHAKGGA